VAVAYSDYFGYLPVNETFKLTLGTVAPIDRYQTAVQLFSDWTNADGHVYPPLVHEEMPNELGKADATRSARPAALYRLPPTHQIDLPTQPDDREQARYGVAAFVIHFFGVLYGRRCHFYDWWIDRRTSSQSVTDHSEPLVEETVYCVEQGHSQWISWPQRQRIAMINAMYLKSRAHSYEMEWERFQAEYQVFDALYSIARALKIVQQKTAHENRIPVLCDAFSIPHDSAYIAPIVRLRNDLLHEAIWASRMPGEARGHEAFHSAFWLNRLCQRIILRLLAIDGPYPQSAWWPIIGSVFRITR